MKKILSLLFLIPLYTSSEEVCNEFPKQKVKETKVEEKVFIVSGTIYMATKSQCDSIPNQTASGYIIDTLNAFKSRTLAISRDLKSYMKFGTKVRISGVNPKCMNGIWNVRDVKNKRYTKSIDFLVDERMKFSRTSWDSIKVELI